MARRSKIQVDFVLSVVSTCLETSGDPTGLGLCDGDEAGEAQIASLSDVCRSLLATHPGSHPTQLELDAAWFLVSNYGDNQDTVLHAVCVAAVHWGRHELWEKAVKTYLRRGPVTWLQPQWVLDGMRKFGLQRVISTYVFST